MSGIAFEGPPENIALAYCWALEERLLSRWVRTRDPRVLTDFIIVQGIKENLLEFLRPIVLVSSIDPQKVKHCSGDYGYCEVHGHH